MNKLHKEYDFEDGPHMGRWGKAPRKGYILTSKKPQKRKLFLKEVDISTKRFKQEYDRESKANAICTKPFPTQCLKTWTENKQGFILSNYMDSVRWSNVPKKHEQKAVESFAKQLRHIHKCKLSHGDLAPKNVLVNKKGQTSIIDFEDAFPLTKETKEEDWDTFHSMFFPYSPKERKDQKLIRLFNYAQLAAPNQGCVLQLTKLRHNESKSGYAFNLVDGKTKVGRVLLIKRKSGKWKNWVYVANAEVFPKYRRKGYCTKMMDQIKMFGIGSFIGSFYLRVERDNQGAVQCYQKAGFEVDEKSSTNKEFVMLFRKNG